MRARYGRATIVGDLRSSAFGPLGAEASAIYDRPVLIRRLYADPGGGEEHYLIRYPPGTRGRLHRHSAAHTLVVLEGRLEANGRVIGPGSYAHFPGGETMRHQAAGDDGCLFVALFHGPFDVEVVEVSGAVPPRR